jgi:ABC-2 type transport system ATP-binding protein
MDPLARRDLRLILQELAGGGASVVVSSHILSELADMCTSVGVMHKGKLLHSGSIADTLASIATESIAVRVELVDSADKVAAWLQRDERVDGIQIESLRVSFRFRGKKQDQHELLRAMIREDFPVVAFAPREAGMESVLMSLITEEPT